MEQDYLIAGLRVRMDTFGRTLSQAEPYSAGTDGKPDITIVSDPQRLQAQQPHLSLDDCEYLCTGGSFYRQLLSHNGLMLHASAVVMDGYAYLFCTRNRGIPEILDTLAGETVKALRHKEQTVHNPKVDMFRHRPVKPLVCKVVKIAHIFVSKVETVHTAVLACLSIIT